METTDVSPAIAVTHASRSFGAVRAVNDLTLTAEFGAVTALVGPNGCGKSTLMLMLAALLRPDSGRVLVGGMDPAEHPSSVKSLVGWMPDQFGAWDSLRVREVLEMIGGAYFLPREQIRERTEHLLDELDLRPLADQRAHVLSRGQKQRLGLARALVHEPRVLILDEPASGLDPAARRRLQQVVRRRADAGAAVLISSHILSELEEMSDAVVLMDEGTVIEQAHLSEIGTRSRTWRVRSLDVSALWHAFEALGVRRARISPPEETTSGYAEALLDLPDRCPSAP
jgi:ABC-2 type transport system ATP-binding protein